MAQRRKWDKTRVLEEIRKLQSELKRKPVKRDSSNLYTYTRKFFSTWNNALDAAGFEIKERQYPKIPNKLTPELAYFLGLLITDGHIVFDKIHKRYRVMIFTSYELEKEIILRIIKKLFNYNASLRSKKYGFNKKINFEIHINSKELSEYFVNKFHIPSGAKSSIVRVPAVFSNSRDIMIESFIRGIIDGDGTISSKSRCVRIASGSEKFLLDIIRLLNKIDIYCGNILKDPRNNTWVLYISGTENLKKLYERMYRNAQFYYPRKKGVWKGI